MNSIRDALGALVHRTRTLWRRIPPALRSGWITAWVTFTGTLLTILTGLLPTLADAISSGDFEPFFDALSIGYASAIAAATAFVAGAVNTLWRWLRPIAGAYQLPPVTAPDPVAVITSIPTKWQDGRPTEYLLDLEDAGLVVHELVAAGVIPPPD